MLYFSFKLAASFQLTKFKLRIITFCAQKSQMWFQSSYIFQQHMQHILEIFCFACNWYYKIFVLSVAEQEFSKKFIAKRPPPSLQVLFSYLSVFS